MKYKEYVVLFYRAVVKLCSFGLLCCVGYFSSAIGRIKKSELQTIRASANFFFFIPDILRIFFLEVSPDIIFMQDLGTESFLLMNLHNSAFALPSTGGEVREIFRQS
jgi:hypothetical protein